jgi:hypothetical protein
MSAAAFVDALAETGLRDIADLSGARKTLVLRKSDKVLDPFNLHMEKRVCPCQASHHLLFARDVRSVRNGKMLERVDRPAMIGCEVDTRYRRKQIG